MKDKSQVTVRLNQNDGSYLAGFIVLAVSLTLLLMSAAAESGGGGPALKSDAVKFETIPGSSIKRVILTAKAAERLGIETGEVSEQQIIRKQMAGGRIIRQDQVQQPKKKAMGKFASLGKFTVASTQDDIGMQTESEAADSDSQWVEVAISEGEWDRLAKDEPVRILQLSTRDTLEHEVLAIPSGNEPVEDSKRSMLKLYYQLPDKDTGLKLYHRVRVEMPLKSSDETKLVVPYSAVYYDAKGGSWIYVNPGPLVYERQRIEIERIEGDFAVLSAGPAVGTRVVTIGTPLLYGAEVVFGK
jgi:hypothetical protein